MEDKSILRSQFVTANIKSLIHEVRGVQVMLDADVAKLYQVETKRVNEVIKRNINRFPESFCFKLTEEEIDDIASRSQFATLNKSNNLRGKNLKYLPYALTEQGIMMLSGLLRSDVAVKVNIQIINAFVEMRRYFANTVENNGILINHENRLLKIEAALDSFSEKPVDRIFFEGELYDAHSLLLDIFNSA
ncbi:ORF6N domain-containing protein, partial [Candidatus Saccharibacteria bacterium]|nr:ORF6N domain-containing protein [Candidatus Saccharibacteria bacterium]